MPHLQERQCITGDGKVIEAGYTRPNGNYVIIQHGQTYTTKYLHLNSKRYAQGKLCASAKL